MAKLALPDPPLGDGVITLRGFASSDIAPIVEICQHPEIPRWTLVRRPGTAHFADDIFVARLRGAVAVGG